MTRLQKAGSGASASAWPATRQASLCGKRNWRAACVVSKWPRMKIPLDLLRWRLRPSRRPATEFNFYPDNGVTELTARLAELHEIDPNQILVTAGSTTFLELIARTLLGPGLNAVTSKLSFIVYPIVTRATGAQLHRSADAE